MMRHLIVLSTSVLLLVPVLAPAQESYTTLEENTWGNPHKSFNFVTIPDWVDSLVSESSPLVVGKPGRSLTFYDGAEPAILAGLPASGQPAALPDSLGDAAVDSTCALPEDLPAHKKGKLKNSLLGETIALALNTRLDPDLIDLDVCSVMLTVAGCAGPDSLYGTADDTLCAACDTMTIRIPEAVMSAVKDSLGNPATVSSILDFANTALAGEDTYDATLKGVWHAVKNINRAFKGCRFLVDCVEDTSFVPIEAKSPSGGSDGPERSGEISGSSVTLATTSPVMSSAVVHFAVPEPSAVDLVLYNVAGREVAVLMDDFHCDQSAYIEFPIDRQGRMPSGVYFVRLSARAVGSGAQYHKTAKMLIVR